ncbi:unnamed protein product [Closterium sp. Yama58-4]|nr:unnamed protein product [Closterium sp. Yama58-4]
MFIANASRTCGFQVGAAALPPPGSHRGVARQSDRCVAGRWGRGGTDGGGTVGVLFRLCLALADVTRLLLDDDAVDAGDAHEGKAGDMGGGKSAGGAVEGAEGRKEGGQWHAEEGGQWHAEEGGQWHAEEGGQWHAEEGGQWHAEEGEAREGGGASSKEGEDGKRGEQAPWVGGGTAWQAAAIRTASVAGGNDGDALGPASGDTASNACADSFSPSTAPTTAAAPTAADPDSAVGATSGTALAIAADADAAHGSNQATVAAMERPAAAVEAMAAGGAADDWLHVLHDDAHWDLLPAFSLTPLALPPLHLPACPTMHAPPPHPSAHNIMVAGQRGRAGEGAVGAADLSQIGSSGDLLAATTAAAPVLPASPARGGTVCCSPEGGACGSGVWHALGARLGSGLPSDGSGSAGAGGMGGGTGGRSAAAGGSGSGSGSGSGRGGCDADGVAHGSVAVEAMSEWERAGAARGGAGGRDEMGEGVAGREQVVGESEVEGPLAAALVTCVHCSSLLQVDMPAAIPTAAICTLFCGHCSALLALPSTALPTITSTPTRCSRSSRPLIPPHSAGVHVAAAAAGGGASGHRGALSSDAPPGALAPLAAGRAVHACAEALAEPVDCLDRTWRDGSPAAGDSAGLAGTPRRVLPAVLLGALASVGCGMRCQLAVAEEMGQQEGMGHEPLPPRMHLPAAPRCAARLHPSLPLTAAHLTLAADSPEAAPTSDGGVGGAGSAADSKRTQRALRKRKRAATPIGTPSPPATLARASFSCTFQQLVFTLPRCMPRHVYPFIGTCTHSSARVPIHRHVYPFIGTCTHSSARVPIHRHVYPFIGTCTIHRMACAGSKAVAREGSEEVGDGSGEEESCRGGEQRGGRASSKAAGREGVAPVKRHRKASTYNLFIRWVLCCSSVPSTTLHLSLLCILSTCLKPLLLLPVSACPSRASLAAYPLARLALRRDEMMRLRAANPHMDHREAFKEAARRWGSAAENVRGSHALAAAARARALLLYPMHAPPMHAPPMHAPHTPHMPSAAAAATAAPLPGATAAPLPGATAAPLPGARVGAAVVGGGMGQQCVREGGQGGCEGGEAHAGSAGAGREGRWVVRAEEGAGGAGVGELAAAAERVVAGWWGPGCGVDRGTGSDGWEGGRCVDGLGSVPLEMGRGRGRHGGCLSDVVGERHMQMQAGELNMEPREEQAGGMAHGLAGEAAAAGPLQQHVWEVERSEQQQAPQGLHSDAYRRLAAGISSKLMSSALPTNT